MRIGFKAWMKDPARCMELVNRNNSKKCIKIDPNKAFRSKRMQELLSKSGYTMEENNDEFILYDENGKVIQRFKKEQTSDSTSPTDGNNKIQSTAETSDKK